jgi:gamma-glutamyltranspeptidase/glutathione hydrolase
MTVQRKSLISGALLAFAWVCPKVLFAGEAQPVYAQHGMVVSVRDLASQAGVDVLKQGGNAVDAAVATGFALAVVHPQAGNLGGGGFMLVRMADGKTHFVDFRETAPAAATEKMYLDANGNIIPNASLIGYRSIGVPGSVAGLAYAEKHYGKLSLAKVMAPAIRLARDGYALTYTESQDFKDPDLAKFPESRRIFQRDGNYYQQGEIFKQPELAKTLERIAKNPDDFYHGEIAHQLAADMQKGGGLITEKDLADYKVVERPPIDGTYRGYEIISAPPPSSGGTVMLEALNILEPIDLGRMGADSADSIHWVVEAFRRAYKDRADFMGDPDFVRVPVAQILDKKYAAEWRASINPLLPTASAELKRPDSGLNQLARPAAMLNLDRRESDETTHYSVVDEQGSAVAVTYTLNDWFGSRVTAEGLGFLLNDEMDDFTSKPGEPNTYGLIQGEANAIAPHKRPLSSMAPTIVLKNGKLFLVLGSPGGSRIISTVTNFILNVVDYGMNIQEAVDAPRFHHQWMPDEIRMERLGISPDTEKLLENRGYKLNLTDPWSDGECIMVDQKTGELAGASDARNGGKAVGY